LGRLQRGDDRYRLAQTNRLIRFCNQIGVSSDDAVWEEEIDLSPILNAEGKIVPEPIDFEQTETRIERR
jgi:hypothetical protein